MLKFYYENEADIPADHKALFEQRELELTGSKKLKAWVLKVDGVVPKERFVEFRDNNKTLSDNLNKLTERFAGIEEPEKARQLLKIAGDIEVSEAEKVLKKGGVDAIVEGRTKALKEDYEKKLADALSKVSVTQAKLDNHILDNGVMTALATLQTQPGAQTFIMREARERFKVIEGQIVAVDANGSVQFSEDDPTQKLGLGEWIPSLQKKYPFLFQESTGGGGAGSGGGGGGGTITVNPWKPETWSKTQQGEIYRKDKALAERLAKAAGSSLTAAQPAKK